MGYYGSDPTPVSIEPASEDVTDALDTIQAAGDSDVEASNPEDLGDGLRVARGLKI
jgi:hypothetical protein